jgi:hypothetical protein
MTCVLASPWNPLSTNVSWSSMNQNLPDSSYSGLERTQSHGYASSGSEQPKKTGSTTKKRASRAGTRSVSTLSAAQLERKRANDREAQRAIRQRTKDHIDGLESTIAELRRSQEASDKISLATRQRNRELEEENSYLRLRLSEAGLTADLPPQSMSIQAYDEKERNTNDSCSFTPPRFWSHRDSTLIARPSRCEHTTSGVDIDIAKLLGHASRSIWLLADAAGTAS